MIRALVVLLALVVLSACRGAPGGPLFENGWVLSGVLVEGQPIEVASPSSNRWRFLRSGGCEPNDPDCPAGPKLRGADLCNSFTRGISVDGDTVVWGTYWETTAADCGAAGGDPIEEFYRQGSFTYLIDGEEMRATSVDGRIELVFTTGA